MSARGVITDFFDIPELKAQAQAASVIVQQYIDSIKSIPSIRAQVTDTSNIKASVTAMGELAGANAKAAASAKQVIDTQIQSAKASSLLADAKLKEAKAIAEVSRAALNEVKASKEASQQKIAEAREADRIAQQNLKAAASKISTQEQATLKVTTQAANKEIIDQAKAMLIASEAAKTGGETVELLRTKLKSLTQDRDTKINILDPVALDKANQQIATVKAQLDKIEQAGGNFKGNVGNYTNSINILKASLDKATASMSKMTEAGTQNNAEGQALSREISLLTTLVGQQAHGFTSLTREASNVGRAVETIHEQLQLLKADGQQNSAAFQQLEETFLTLNTEFTNAKRKLNEFRMEQKILTDQVPKIAALTAAARGLGGIYATAAGGAQLLAPENEHLAEKLNQLVAVMTLLQGLEEVHRLITERNAIATALFGTTTVATTVALEVEAVAAQAATEATTGLNRALIFLGENPITLFLVGLAAVVIYLVSTFESEEEQLKKVAKASKDYSNDVKDLSEALSTQNDILAKSLKDQKIKLENDLAAAKAGGITAQQELARKTEILNLDKKIADADFNSRKDIDGDIERETEKQAALNARKEQQLDITNKLLKLQDEGVKKVLKGTTTAIDEKIKTLSEKSLEYSATAISAQTGNAAPITQQNIKDAIKASRKLQDINNDAISAAKGAVESLEKVRDNKTKADAAALENENAIAKLSADDRRRIALATAQLEVSAEQDKNSIILGDERSTFAQRIEAMKSNQEQEKKLADAELKDIEGDTTKSDAEKLIARDEHFAKLAKIEKDGAEAIRKETLSDHIRLLTAQQEFNKSLISEDVEAQEIISKDQTADIDKRLEAYGKYTADQIKQVKDDAAYQKATKVLTAEEIVALDEETAAKLKTIAIKSGKDLSDILASSLKEQESLRESFDNLALAKTESVNLEDKTGNARKKAIEENSKLEYEAQRDRLQGELDTDQQIRDNILSSTEAKEKASIDYNNKQAELYKLDVDRANKAEQDKLNAKKKVQDLEVQIASQTIDIIQTLGDRAYQKNVDQIQSQIDLIEQRKAKDIEVADQTITNSQDKADTIAVINAKAQSQEELLNQKKRQEQEKQARFDKASGIAKIILSTAVAEIEALAYLSNPFTAALYPAIATLIGVLGAAQLAVAIATPIPKFAKGGITPGGKIMVGDGGKHEGVRLPDGTVLKTPSYPVVWDVPKGSEVFSDFDKMLLNATMTKGPEYSASNRTDITAIAVQRMGQMVVSAIKDKQENHWHMPGRYDMAMRDGSKFKAYLKTDM